VSGPSLEQQIRQALAVIEQLRGDNEVLRADYEALRAENLALADRVAALESELKKDSITSSKPPSTDAVRARQSRAERRAEARSAKRAQDKQPGAGATNLNRRTPEVTIGHQPACCAGCGADLSDAELVGEIRRQVIDLPPVRPTVVDHVAYRCRCRCGTETTAEFPPEAKAPVCWGPGVRALAVYLLDRQHLPVERTGELLADLLDAPVSTGWLCQV
jgi:transposase